MSTQRILTTHAGSLVKPRAIREALAAQQAGKPYDEESFRRQLAHAVTEVVRRGIQRLFSSRGFSLAVQHG